MTPSQQQAIDAIRERHARATPGPYRVEPHHCPCFDNGEPTDGFDVEGPRYVGDMECPALIKDDAEFFAHSWSDIAHLLSRIDELTAELDAATAALAAYRAEKGPVTG